MLPYYLLIAIPLVFAFGYELYYEKTGKKGQKKNYTIIVFYIIYFVLLAFRDESIGVDTPNYIMLYEAMPYNSYADVLAAHGKSDIGYYLFTKTLALFFENSQWLLIIVAAITTIPFAYLYYKETKNSLVTIALLMVLPTFQMNFSGLRQAIAISFIVPAIYFVQKKKLFIFIVLVIIAMLFHRSAFIILLFYPLYHCKITWKQLIMVSFIGALVYRYNTQIFLLTASLMGGKFEERYAYVTETGAYTMLIVFLLFTIYSFVFVNGEIMSMNEKGYRNLLLAALFLQMFAPINSIAMRMGYYYMPFIPVVITQSTKKLKIKQSSVKLAASIVIYTLFTWYYLDKSLNVDTLDIYPYMLR